MRTTSQVFGDFRSLPTVVIIRSHKPEAHMKRTIVLGALVAACLLSMVVTGQQGGGAAQDQPKKIVVEKLKDNLYVLRGNVNTAGGNTAVFITANGVVVVDAKNPGWGKPILDA